MIDSFRKRRAIFEEVLILALRLAQKVSIGFKSGEYGGKKSNVQPAFSISVFVFSDL